MKTAFAALSLVLSINAFASQTFECTTKDKAEVAIVTVDGKNSNIQLKGKNYDSYVLNLKPSSLRSICRNADVSGKGTIVQYASPDVSFLIYVNGAKSLAAPSCAAVSCKKIK